METIKILTAFDAKNNTLEHSKSLQPLYLIINNAINESSEIYVNSTVIVKSDIVNKRKLNKVRQELANRGYSVDFTFTHNTKDGESVQIQIDWNNPFDYSKDVVFIDAKNVQNLSSDFKITNKLISTEYQSQAEVNLKTKTIYLGNFVTNDKLSSISDIEDQTNIDTVISFAVKGRKRFANIDVNLLKKYYDKFENFNKFSPISIYSELATFAKIDFVKQNIIVSTDEEQDFVTSEYDFETQIKLWNL